MICQQAECHRKPCQSVPAEVLAKHATAWYDQTMSCGLASFLQATYTDGKLGWKGVGSSAMDVKEMKVGDVGKPTQPGQSACYVEINLTFCKLQSTWVLFTPSRCTAALCQADEFCRPGSPPVPPASPRLPVQPCTSSTLCCCPWSCLALPPLLPRVALPPPLRRPPPTPTWSILPPPTT